MELDDLKSTWNSLQTPVRSSSDIRMMLSENNHPVIKRIRRQLTIEIIGWSLFLACYYSMFDGGKKPVWINLILIISILLPILHSLMGYRFEKFLSYGMNVRDSLNHYLTKIKRYAIISIVTRQIYLAGFLLFFSYGANINTNKSILLAGMCMIILTQLLISCKIWSTRLKDLRVSLKSFS